VALVESLLTAIVRTDGDALVLHVGERPYVVAPTGQSELASRALTLEAMTGMLGELLSSEARQALAEYGAVQHDLHSPVVAEGERFAVVAAQGGDDIWIEIRRHRKPVVVEAPAPAPVSELTVEEQTEVDEPDVDAGSTDHEPLYAADGDEMALEVVEDDGSLDADLTYALDDTRSPDPMEPSASVIPEPVIPEPVIPEPVIPEPVIPEPVIPEAVIPEPVIPKPVIPEAVIPEAVIPEPVIPEAVIPEAVIPEAVIPEAVIPEAVIPKPVIPKPVIENVAGPRRVEPPEPVHEEVRRADLADSPDPRPGVVLPIARNQVRPEQTVRFSQPPHTAGIDRLLRIAAARGASTLYLTSQARPSIRVDGEISPIDGEPVLGEPDVEALMLDIIPERNRETLRSQAGTEWICDVPDVGRIRCVTFRDHRGAGGIFRMIPARAISAEQLGLSREIQGLCAEAEGLVLVTGPRSSGKSTLISAFVDLVNRTRSDHVITLENQIKFVHENRGSLVSQREVRGDNNELMQVARAALRENPDVLVIEDFGSPEIVMLALEAAQSGHLVIGALTGHTATEAVDRIIDQTPPERRLKVQLGLAENLRGIVAQVLLRKIGGGRVAAREVLLNTSAVANLIVEGKTSQLPMAIDSGRKHGMVALNEALVAFVKGGIVDSREAYRQAADRPGFLALLKRQGIDTSFVERLA
jgi:twitching motility protein PilT